MQTARLLILATALLASTLPVAAAPILSPSTTVYGGVVSGTDFVTGAVGTVANTNNWPAGEPPTDLVNRSIGGDGEKYLNFAVTNTAVIFAGTTPLPVNRMELWVANDAPERDPASYQLYGTNAAIPALTSGQTVALSSFTLLSEGALALSATRDIATDATGFSQSVLIPNTTAYTAYLLVFPTVRGPGANSMQLSEVQLYHSTIIGTESFEYLDGPLAGKNSGQLWNWKNRTPAGRTAGTSDWDNVTGTPTIGGGRLVTDDSAAKREYNGPGEGLPIETDEGLGAVNNFSSGPISFQQHAVYYRVTVTTGATLPDAFGLSSYDFGDERVFFGKPFGQGHFGVGVTGNTLASGFPVAPNTTYTLVTKLDYLTSTAAIFVNPDLSAPEPVPLLSLSFDTTKWSTAVRLASAGSGAVTWDDLVVATAWSDLAPVVVTTADDEDDGPASLGNAADISLREAVQYAPVGSRVTFAPALSGQTITLTHADGDMLIPSALTVDATALPGGLTVSGNNTHRHFKVETGKSLTLRGLTFTRGNGTGGGFPVGGSILNEGTLTLDRCTLTGNASTSEGGAIYSRGTLRATDCTISDNAATGNGGGFLLFSGTVELSRCTISGNVANTGGAFAQGADTTLSHCTVTGNRTTGTNTTGSIYAFGGTLNLQHCTVSQNIGSGLGGGLYMQSPATANVGFCLIAGNADPGGTRPDIYYNGGTFNTLGTSLIGDNTSVEAHYPAGPFVGTGAAPLDPKLSPLGHFGGSVQTLHPLIGSPAIDGASTIDPGGTDARGFPRFVDGDANGTPAFDFGAVEAGLPLIVLASGDGGGLTLRSALAFINSSTAQGLRITFDPALFPASTITLAGNELTAPAGKSFFIDASNLSGPVTISGGDDSRVFSIPATATVAMHSLRIVNGKAANAADVFDGTAGVGQNGGGVLNAGKLSLMDCTVSGNAAGNGGSSTNTSGDGGDGGGIYNTGVLHVVASTLSGNSAGNGGGSLTSTETGDGGHGGGIFNSGTLSIVTSTLAGNSAGNGPFAGFIAGDGGNGGALSSSGSVSLTACTLSGNAVGSHGGTDAPFGSPGAPGSGGGIFHATNAFCRLENCLVANNTATSGPDIRKVTGPVSAAGVNFIGTLAGSGLIVGPTLLTGNPLLAPLANYGGRTHTMPLRPGSPALDAGAVTSLLTDQRGYPRIGTADLGAYEAGNGLLTNYNAFIWESLPATATAQQHDTAFDFDGDGRSNEDEWLAFTQPGDPGSYFALASLVRNGGFLFLTFPTVAGRTYRLQSSPDLTAGSWVGSLFGFVQGDGSVKTFIVTTGPAESLFFRVTVSNDGMK
ncbi:MAG: hypothetical protein KA004_00930 [Verrucomicrobiales bacterium]|nr:hypothetical protein [Verrucomicrobiales bacterium]